MSSGIVNDTFALIQRVQDISVNYQIPRTDIRVIGRMKPLDDRPVINYTPVSLSANGTMGNGDVPKCFGLVNSTGVLVQIGQNTEVTNWGCRSFQIYNAPINSTSNAGQFNVFSGVLKSFGLNGTVNDPVRYSFAVEGLGYQEVANNAAKTIPTYAGNVVKSQNIAITGIDFTGLGFSGLSIQSFSYQQTMDYASTFKIGTQLPDRRITNGMATLQIVGFFEGQTNTITGLNTYDCGSYITGIYSLAMTPSCSNEPALTIRMFNPYLESQTIGIQVGNYTSVELSLSVPLTTVAAEVTGPNMGSNVTIT